MAAVQEGVKIAEVSDHGYGGIYSQAPALSLIQNLHDYGFKTPGLSVPPVLDASDILRRERRLYEKFTSPFRGFDPTVKRHKLPGGAVSLALEQAEKAGLIERAHEVFGELIEVRKEMGNIWMVTPGSQILWSTALSNVLNGRYEKPSDDLKKLLLGGYGPFPFYDPHEWIFQKVLESGRTDGKRWDEILAEEAGLHKPADEDMNGQAPSTRTPAQKGRNGGRALHVRAISEGRPRFLQIRRALRADMAASPGCMVPRGRLSRRHQNFVSRRNREDPQYRAHIDKAVCGERSYFVSRGLSFPDSYDAGFKKQGKVEYWDCWI